MDVAGIRDALHKQRFEPFVMRLADERSLPVHHPDFVAVSRRAVVVVADDEIGSWSVVEPLLIVSLDKLKQKGKGGNGSAKGRKS